jgi:hypothetical protein
MGFFRKLNRFSPFSWGVFQKRTPDKGVSTFSHILKRAEKAGHLPGRSRWAIKWLRNVAKRHKTTAERIIKYGKKEEKMTIKPIIGKMYFFFYDPKHKKTLPYYDRFPLVIPIKYYKDGFLGLNLHYLPLKYRAALFDGLFNLLSDDKFDDLTRFKISYEVLNHAAGTPYYLPCVKRYLKSHYESKFLQIHPDEWDIALFLPVERFRKMTKQQVWKESKKIISNVRKRR